MIPLKQENFRIIVVLFALGVALIQSVHPIEAQYLELDTTADVWVVIDGDTFDAFPVGRIRLADIDAPEQGESGYDASRDYLDGLIDGKQIFLDVDDNFMDDSFERLICVVYVRKNVTHLWNVNMKMVVENFAVKDDFTNNEFNPDTWTETISYPTIDLPESDYRQLLSDYQQLTKNYESLEVQNRVLQVQYTSMLVEYNTLNVTYEALKNMYDNLNSTYAILEGKYGELQMKVLNLESECNTLNKTYSQLQTDYLNLQIQHEQNSSVLGLYQPLSYVLIAISAFLGVIIIRSRTKGQFSVSIEENKAIIDR